MPGQRPSWRPRPSGNGHHCQELPASGFGPQAADWVSRTLAHAGVEVLSSSVVHNSPKSRTPTTAAAATPSGSPWAIQPRDHRRPCALRSGELRSRSARSAEHSTWVPTDRRRRARARHRPRVGGRRRGSQSSEAQHITAAEADSVASSIIATLGLGKPLGAPLPALHGILVDAPEQRWWDANSEHLHDEQMASGCLWWPPEEALGAHLARWAHTHDHAVHAEIHWHPNGLPVIVTAPAGDPLSEMLTPAVHPQSKDLLHDSENRERMAIRRIEHQMAATAHELKDELQALDKSQQRSSSTCARRATCRAISTPPVDSSPLSRNRLPKTTDASKPGCH